MATTTIATDSCATFTIPPNTTNLFVVTDLVFSITAILFQVHTGSKINVVDIGPGPPLENYLTGSDVGFVQPLRYNEKYANCFVRNPSSTNSSKIQLCSTSLSNRDPIPGGCAQEFSLPMVPTLTFANIGKDDNFLQIKFAPANGPYDRYSGEHNCDSEDVKNNLKYHLYGLFLNHNQFNLNEDEVLQSLHKFFSPENVYKNAYKVFYFSYGIP